MVGRRGLQGGHERVSEITIAYFCTKVCWKVGLFTRKRQISPNQNWHFEENRKFLSWRIRNRSPEFFSPKIKILEKNLRNFSDKIENFYDKISRPPDFAPDWRRRIHPPVHTFSIQPSIYLLLILYPIVHSSILNRNIHFIHPSINLSSIRSPIHFYIRPPFNTSNYSSNDPSNYPSRLSIHPFTRP